MFKSIVQSQNADPNFIFEVLKLGVQGTGLRTQGVHKDRWIQKFKVWQLKMHDSSLMLTDLVQRLNKSKFEFRVHKYKCRFRACGYN